MRIDRLSLILAVFALVAVIPAAADCGQEHAKHAEAATEAPCCAGGGHAQCPGSHDGQCSEKMAGHAANLISSAENGDSASMNQIIAMVKGSGHEDMVALATKAEAGDEKAQTALLAKVKEMHADPSALETASLSQLAKQAGSGCPKSAAALIAKAKKSDNKEMVELATRAEGGCEHSKSALIAMTQAETTEAN